MQPKQHRAPQRATAAGFTLVELLIVILIIAILISILIPTVSKVRMAVRIANTKSQLSQITSAIERYYAEQHQYPGPLPSNDLYVAGRNQVASPPGVPTYPMYEVTGATQLTRFDHITQEENLVLGLFGGCKWVLVGAQYHLCFDPGMVGLGMMGMNPGQPKKFAAYIDDTKMLSDFSKTGQPPPLIDRYSDAASVAPWAGGASGADDSPIPEIVDKFPNAMPFLYLRARVGASGVIRDNITKPETNNPLEQYDLSDIYAYTKSSTSAIGEGKKAPQYYQNGVIVATPNPPAHGLQVVNATASMSKTLPTGAVNPKYQYPYDAYPYLTSPTSTPTALTPRSKDTYILISAGADRIYGTNDDICSFGDVLP